MVPATFSHILFPIDYSPRCIATIPFIKEMVRRNGSRLTAMNVVDTVVQVPGVAGIMYFATAGALDDPFLASQKRLARFIREQFRDITQDFQVEDVCKQGDATTSITQYAERNAMDLIMMPTRGCGTFRRFLLGAVTAKVLHDAHCPVWTDAHVEHQPAWKHMNLCNILCAVDLTEHSDQVIRWALAVARANSSRLRLVHVVQLEEIRAYSYYDATFQRVLNEAACEQLAEVQRKAGIDVESDVEGGDVPKTVRAAALRHQADLVVIGRGHIQAPLGRLRTNAYGIIRESPCPGLSV